jgi:hypothetical protein
MCANIAFFQSQVLGDFQKKNERDRHANYDQRRCHDEEQPIVDGLLPWSCKVVSTS